MAGDPRFAAGIRLPALLLFAAACAVLVPCTGCRSAAAPFNLVVVSLDTLRADHLHCYGYGRETSPRIDALAADAVLFEHVVSQANETVRSHLSFMTSTYPHLALTDRSRPVLAGILHDQGLATAAFTDGGPMSRDFGFDRGFDEFGDKEGGLARKTREGLRWIDGLAEGRRFFLFLHCFDIHLPYNPPRPYEAFFDPDNPSRIHPDQTVDICRKVRRIHEYADFQGEVELSDADRQRLLDLYDGGIRYTDEVLGRFLDALTDRGLIDRTVVVVLSDHGEEFWDHGSLLHGHTLYNELTHVPLIVRIPGLSPRRVTEQVALLDLLPTLLDALDLPALDGLEGISLMPLMRGESLAGAGRRLISEGMEVGHYAILEDGYKLIRRPDLRRYELYNLEKDPGERVSVAKGQMERARRMIRQLDDHHRRLSKAISMRGRPQTPSRDDLDPRTVRRLQELGYMATEQEAGSGNPADSKEEQR